MGVSLAELRRQAELKRIEAFLVSLAEWMPEPPTGWREAAKPPGSAPRTGGRKP
jgi:hypothetical protein